MSNISRKEFIELTGLSLAVLLIPSCLSSCKKSNPTPSNNQTIDFTVSVSSGALSQNGGYIVQNGVIVARTNTGAFIAVAVACTHEGTAVRYVAASNSFSCPNHGAKFDASGNVTAGPATTALKKYNTSLSGTDLRVYS
jgi:cytochrome b6-f complex iron-sulfur subunit